MDFDFLIDSLTPAVVEKKKKYANFKLTPIGGQDDIVKWREMQEAKASVYRMRLNEREDRIALAEASFGHKLSSPTIHTTGWSEKLAFAKSERVRLAKLEDVAARTWEPAVEVKKSVLQRIKGFIAGLWSESNF